MKAYRSYTVQPRLPECLQPLRDVAMNLWWSYTPDAREVLRRVDRDLWDESGHNPIKMMGMISQERWQELAADDSFRQHLDRVRADFTRHLSEETWFGRNHARHREKTVAYFSFEYGLSEALPIYAGGLGVLAGDHLKSAGDMGVPVVGVGLLYQVGYFSQYLNPDGWQQEEYSESDFHTMPIEQVRCEDGICPLCVQVPIGDRVVHANVWRVDVGRVPLYLLDTNTEANAPADRLITYQLYGGDLDMRIRQEMLLGIGGVQALRHCLEVDPSAFHLNEGHAAFLTLERIRQAMTEHDLSFAEASEATRVGNIFTTHTPVVAGHDRFPRSLIERYFSRYHPQLGLTMDQFMQIGAGRAGTCDHFSMTVLALRFSAWRNGVSKLHGEVSRKTWAHEWPGLPVDEVPIDSITNGIHTRSVISDDMASLFDRYLGKEWRTEPGDQSIWERVTEIPEAELWRAHERRRERLVAVARRRLHAQLQHRGAGQTALGRAREAPDPEALTIGFGRRFATYKRATLILRDRDRLRAMLTDRDRPIQLIFAGKAHPDDRPGKELIREVVHFTNDPEVRQRVVFLEDYDLQLARYIVQGVDVWLNTPRRPLEASGTSGMKVTANGGLNCSVLDGWWDEAYAPETGWAIGRGEEYTDREHHDEVESEALYTLLEQEIVPLFYERGADGVPHGWVAKMKSAMRAICPNFNSNRMVAEYVSRFYLPALSQAALLAADDYRMARDLAAWRERVESNWPSVTFLHISDTINGATRHGDTITVIADLCLGELSPDDVMVQLQHGNVDHSGEVMKPREVRMKHTGHDEGSHRFTGEIVCDGAGRWGYTARVLPNHYDVLAPADSGHITWTN
ncbi:MAG: alpha-glucan family phosphorylase [Armatimonadota bacterium]